MKTWLIPITLALAGTSARADQCELVDQRVAQIAHDILAKQPMVIAYCEPCGDKAPGEPYLAKTVALQHDVTTRDQDTTVSINDRSVDLAYTYVKISPKLYQNLAMLAGCPVEDVSPSLTVADETKHGVLIVPSSVRPTPISAPPPPPPPAPATASTVYVYSSSHEHVPWLVVVAACGAGFATGAGFLLLALATRRRKAMRPRATDL